MPMLPSRGRDTALGIAVFLCVAWTAGPAGSPQPAEPPTSPKIDFADSRAGRELLLDPAAEAYFSVLGEAEIRIKYGVRADGRPLEQLREQARLRYGAAIRDFSPPEIELLSAVVTALHPFLQERYPLVAAVPWRFLKVDSLVERGLPHTIGGAIVLPQRWVDRFAAGAKEHGRDAAVPDVGFWLLHEKLHVVQRSYPDLFRGLYEDRWKFRFVAELDRGDWLAERRLTNPDAAPGYWLWTDPRGDGKRWIWPTLIVRPELMRGAPGPLPGGGTAIEVIAVEISFEDGRPAVRLDDAGQPRYTLLDSVGAYRARFPFAYPMALPEEIAADAFARIAIEDLTYGEGAFASSSRNRRWKIVDLRRWFEENLRDPEARPTPADDG